MRILNRIAIAAVVALFLAAALTPAQAACGAPSQISTVTADGTSFIWNGAVFTPNYYYGAPGYAPGMYPGNPPVTSAFEGVFWSVGTGDPAIGSGDDSGAFTVDYWFSYYALPSIAYYESGQIFTTWAANSIIDGCISNAGVATTTCTCVLLTDQNGVDGQYALIANATDVNEDTFLAQLGTDGNGNPGQIVLASIPKPSIESSLYNGSTGDITLTVNVSGGSADYNLNPGTCPCGPTGYKIFQIQMPFNSPPPDTRDVAAWTESVLPGGGAQPVTPMGADVAIESICGIAERQDVYLATQLFFDSDFTTSVVSTDSTRIECGPNLAEPDQPTRPRMAPGAPRDLRAPRQRTSR